MIDQRISKLLLILAIVVVFMMFIGALTRLTGSGLSIPEWPLINGTLMYPFSEADWTKVFLTYQNYPQFHLINANMTLDEFQWIFFFEYFHRSITSVVSLLLSVIAFIAIRNKGFWRQYKFAIINLILLLFVQALAGYYMVKSGLEVDKASVSQYRLALHLFLASIFLSLILWTRWKIIYKKGEAFGKLKWSVIIFPFLLFLQMVSGAFMAGTDAGFHFNDWPFMNGDIVPPIFVNTGKYSDNIWLNFTENIANIQFFHRLLAYFLFLILIKDFFDLKKFTDFKRKIYIFLPVIVILQVSLGISILLFHMPLNLASIHQLLAIILLIQVLYISFHRYYQQN